MNIEQVLIWLISFLFTSAITGVLLTVGVWMSSPAVKVALKLRIAEVTRNGPTPRVDAEVRVQCRSETAMANNERTVHGPD